MKKALQRGAVGAGGHKVDGLAKFREWAKQHDSVPIEHGPRQSRIGGKQHKGLRHVREDDASNKERYERSEEFIHRERESFPED